MILKIVKILKVIDGDMKFVGYEIKFRNFN